MGNEVSQKKSNRNEPSCIVCLFTVLYCTVLYYRICRDEYNGMERNGMVCDKEWNTAIVSIDSLFRGVKLVWVLGANLFT
mmetsp:Transcript_15967/g.32897  ORF Transcript_15967/g.32897 Transcript_15967/m.32897 type:complete len:80 (-) Transcript_15967:207-446(-)